MQALILAADAPHSKLLSAAVQAYDFEPIVCRSIADAVASFADHVYPLVIGEFRNAANEIQQLCRAIREHPAQNRALVLIVAERNSTAEFETILAAGADDYLPAPLDPALVRIRLQVAIRKIHMRRAAGNIEQELRQSIERFELAVQGANDGLWDAQTFGMPWNRPETEVWFSPRMKQMLGYTDEEFPNVMSSWATALHPDDRDETFKALEQHIEQKQPYDVEYRLQTKSGEYRWFSARGEALWDENGNLLRMAGSLRDITQAKCDEETIRKNAAEWKSLVDNAPDIIMLADLDGTIKSINRHNPYADDSIGRTTYDYIEAQYKPLMREAFEAIRTTGKAQRYELQGKSETGDGIAWYSNRIGPILNNGKVESVVFIATDITQRKNAEAQLIRERQSLRRLLDVQERERQMVAYDIHDGLVQYLAGGLMHLEAFAANVKDPSVLTEYDRGMSLLRDAVAEARRLISGLRPPILDEHGVVAALEYLVNESRPYIPDLDFIHKAFFGRLSPACEAAIFRITQEALSNIRRHSGSKRARIELRQHGQWVRLLIRDWGCGFKPDQVHEDRFGLQGIRQRAVLLGTLAVIESAPNQGTLIAVDFPLIQDEPETTEDAAVE